jgi:hypothetical protein
VAVWSEQVERRRADGSCPTFGRPAGMPAEQDPPTYRGVVARRAESVARILAGCDTVPAPDVLRWMCSADVPRERG